MPVKTPIYMDNNATTPLLPQVFEVMRPYMLESFGNASSIHQRGQQARAAVESAREQVAELLSSRAMMGSKIDRMDASLQRLEAADVEAAKLLSEVEDADITQLVTQLAKEQNLYQAALLAGSKALQPSLLDFLD